MHVIVRYRLEVKIFYENWNNMIKKTHQLTPKSIEKIKNIIKES